MAESELLGMTYRAKNQSYLTNAAEIQKFVNTHDTDSFYNATKELYKPACKIIPHVVKVLEILNFWKRFC